MTKTILRGKLSAATVDAFCDRIEQELSKTKLRAKDVLRFRISVDASMCKWLAEIGEGAPCTLEIGRRFGRVTIAVSCEGAACNPRDASGDEFGELESSALLQSLGLTVGYTYEKGVNRLKFMPSSGFVLKLFPIAAAFVLGIGLSLLLKKLFPDFAATLNENVVDPVFSTLLGILRAIASPLIFLAVLSGIYGIGNITALGTIGKKLMSRFCLVTFLALGANFIILLPMIQLSVGSYSFDGNTVKDFLALILQFVPTDIVSPFLSGNMLQIITIAVACGLVILLLGERVSELTKIIDQIYSVVQLLMEVIGRFVPFFIFVSMFSFVLSTSAVQFSDILQPIIAIAGTFILLALVAYPMILMSKYKIGYGQLMKKMLPSFLIALTTASSAAAFSSNVETCEKELGISENVTRFGIPLGQVVFMPIAAAEYFSVSLLAAGLYDVPITVLWVITALFICGILAIATPPIPGGSISIFTVLFLQLGIPEAALPIALGIDLLLDYVITAGNIMCLQEELILCADKTGLLDKKTLRKTKR